MNIIIIIFGYHYGRLFDYCGFAASKATYIGILIFFFLLVHKYEKVYCFLPDIFEYHFEYFTNKLHIRFHLRKLH